VVREQSTSEPPNAMAVPAAASPDVPERYMAYVFDDVHLALTDLAQVL